MCKINVVYSSCKLQAINIPRNNTIFVVSFQSQRQSDTIKKLQEVLTQSQLDLDEARKRADEDVSYNIKHVYFLKYTQNNPHATGG